MVWLLFQSTSLVSYGIRVNKIIDEIVYLFIGGEGYIYKVAFPVDCPVVNHVYWTKLACVSRLIRGSVMLKGPMECPILGLLGSRVPGIME